MIITDLFESPQSCPECGGPAFSDLILAEKKDACYYKVKASAKVWPSAYASGRLVQCRKKGAANYGKSKNEGMAEGKVSGYKMYPNHDGTWYVEDENENVVLRNASEGEAQQAVWSGNQKLKQGVAEGSEGQKFIVTYNNRLSNDSYTIMVSADDEYDAKDKVSHALGMGDRITDVKSARGTETTDREYKVFVDPRTSQKRSGIYDRQQSLAEAAALAEEFDLIESIIDRLAEHNGVAAEAIWEDLESLTDDELYVFAVTTPLTEDWQKANKRDRTDGMSRKAVNAYRRENPGSKLKTAVTTKPSKLKRGSKASKRRKSYCSRSRGQMKMHSISCAKTPDKAICKARRRWNCESVDLGQGAAEGSLNEGQYEMMMRNGQVKKFIAKDDADAKRIAAGHGAKSVIRLKGGVPAGKVTEQGVAEEFGPLPKDNQQIRLGKYTVDIERVGLNKNYIGFAWHDSQGQEHYEEVPVGDLGSYDDLIARIKGEIQYQERRLKQGVAEGHADQQRKIFKKNGKPVGEVGIDRESSPGVGQWYMKCYAYNIDNSGHDSYEEAVAELKHCLKQGVAESDTGDTPIDSMTAQELAAYLNVPVTQVTQDLAAAREMARDKAKDMVGEGMADDMLKLAQKISPAARLRGTPDQERERTKQAMAQRDQDRQSREQAQIAADRERLPELEAQYQEMKQLYDQLGGSGWQYADNEQNLSSSERRARAMEPQMQQLASRIQRAKQVSNIEEGSLEAAANDPVVVILDPAGKYLDKMALSSAVQKYRLGAADTVKKQLANQNYTKIGQYTIQSPMSGQSAVAEHINRMCHLAGLGQK